MVDRAGRDTSFRGIALGKSYSPINNHEIHGVTNTPTKDTKREGKLAEKTKEDQLGTEKDKEASSNMINILCICMRIP